MAGRLEGMIALVTGAGGGEQGGIGAGIARCLAQEGASIAVNDLKMDYAEATVQQLASLGAKAIALAADMRDVNQVTAMVNRTAEHFGRLDILVNNAGVGGSTTAVERLTDEEWHLVVDTNLHGPFYASRAAVRLMRPRGFGRIINIASVAAIRISYKGPAAYTAAKAGLLGFSRHLAVETAQHGITVNVVLPGGTSTPLLRGCTTAEARNRIAACIPAQRLAEPEDMGWTVAFLASREACYITGAEIPVDGAFTAVSGDFSAYFTNSGKDKG